MLKPISSFQNKGHSYFTNCKTCRNAWARKYRKTDAGKKSTLKARLQQRYKMTLEEYDALWEKQYGTCAICKQQEVVKCESGAIRRLCVDHDHKTGKVRALLCQKCNKALGYVSDDINQLINLVEYLTFHQDLQQNPN